MKLADAEDEAGARVEMTPMMDVVFLLLVFFIYAFLSMSVRRGIQVSLPKADGAVTPGSQVLLVLTADDTVLLDGRTPMAPDEAVSAAAMRAKTLDLPVCIRADRNAHAGAALELMAGLRADGVSRVAYQVEKRK